MKVAILGAGAGGQAAAADWALAGHTVSMFDFPAFSEQTDGIQKQGGVQVSGQLEGFAPVAYAGQVGSEVLAAATTAITPNGAELAETGVYTVKVTVDSVGGNEARLYNSAGTELAVSSTR